jgi:glucosamine--fructose-6-phosphate aminotransferase (isomerizing)
MAQTMTELLEEISQQPAALSGLRKYYASPGAVSAKCLRGLVTHWPPTVILAGMGSSLYAAYPAQAYLVEQGVRASLWETAELVDHLNILRPDTLLVVVSRSGQTGEVLRLLESLPAKTRVLAVTNVEASPLAKRANLLLPMMASGHAAVSTKSYTCTVAVLMYLAFAIAGKAANLLTQEVMRGLEAEEKILERRDVLIPPLVEFLNRPPYVALMSRGADIASAYQGSMMLKQVARLAAEPMSAAQFRHGPMEIINPCHRYVLFAREGKNGKSLLKLAHDIRKLNGRVLVFTDMPFHDPMNVRWVRVESLRLGLGTLVDSVYMQLLAHDAALRAGLEPGKIEMTESPARQE